MLLEKLCDKKNWNKYHGVYTQVQGNKSVIFKDISVLEKELDISKNTHKIVIKC